MLFLLYIYIWIPVWEIAVHLAVAGEVFDGVFLCCPFSHDMSWIRSGTKMRQFLRVFPPTLVNVAKILGTPSTAENLTDSLGKIR